jgi:hypothetical protein
MNEQLAAHAPFFQRSGRVASLEGSVDVSDVECCIDVTGLTLGRGEGRRHVTICAMTAPEVRDGAASGAGAPACEQPSEPAATTEITHAIG